MASRVEDFFELESQWSESALQIRRVIRTWVQEKYQPRVATLYREGEFCTDLIPDLANLGLLGCTLPDYDCAHMSPLEYGLAMYELERGDSGLRSFVSVHTSLCMFPIWKFGSQEQKDDYLPKMREGTLIGCFGLSEPDFGSNPSGMLMRAEKTSRGFVLNGTKRWITNGGLAQVAVVWAKLEGRVQGFLVPIPSKGLTVRDIPGKLSLRASVTSELIFEDCEVSEGAILPEAKGLRAAFECLNAARFGICFGVLGAAAACLEEALDYALNRDMFGTKLAQKQIVQGKLFEMTAELTKGLLLATRLAELKTSGRLKPEQISLVKANNTRAALEIARCSRDLMGASGITDEYQSMRHLCNLESVHTYEGTFDIHRLIVGEALTGLAAF